MTQPRVVIRPTRNILDLYRRRRYAVVARFPGGREIPVSKARTRAEAFRQARVATSPQTSPTAASIGGFSEEQIPYWKRKGERGEIEFD